MEKVQEKKIISRLYLYITHYRQNLVVLNSGRVTIFRFIHKIAKSGC